MASSLLGQESPKFPHLLSPAQLKEDFTISIQSLEEIHPALYQYIDIEKLKRIEDSILQTQFADSLSAADLHVVLRKYIAYIGCGHTVAMPSTDWYKHQRAHAQFLPFDVFLINDKLFVHHSNPDDTVLTKGVEIISIDGVSSSQLIAEMRAIISSDGLGKQLANYKIAKAFRTYYLFLYGDAAQYQVQYLDKQRQLKTVEIAYCNVLQPDAPAEKKTLYKTLVTGSDATFSISKKDSTLGILDINSFSRKGYKKFYRKMFKEASKRYIQHLVIDLRANGGGYFPNGNRLMAYFMTEPYSMNFERPEGKIQKSSYYKMPFFSKATKAAFNLMPDKDKKDSNRNYSLNYKPRKKYQWQHNTYVLTDGGTFSMGGYVATLMKAHCNATTLGSETGGGEEGSNAILMYNLTLPNSQIRVHIPYYHLAHGVLPRLKGYGVIPAIQTEYTLEDKLKNNDLEMEVIYKLIESQNTRDHERLFNSF